MSAAKLLPEMLTVLARDTTQLRNVGDTAGVARADLPLLAQLLPGHHLRFREVTVEVAQAEWRRLRGALESLRR